MARRLQVLTISVSEIFSATVRTRADALLSLFSWAKRTLAFEITGHHFQEGPSAAFAGFADFRRKRFHLGDPCAKASLCVSSSSSARSLTKKMNKTVGASGDTPPSARRVSRRLPCVAMLASAGDSLTATQERPGAPNSDRASIGRAQSKLAKFTSKKWHHGAPASGRALTGRAPSKFKHTPLWASSPSQQDSDDPAEYESPSASEWSSMLAQERDAPPKSPISLYSSGFLSTSEAQADSQPSFARLDSESSGPAPPAPDHRSPPTPSRTLKGSAGRNTPHPVRGASVRRSAKRTLVTNLHTALRRQADAYHKKLEHYVSTLQSTLLAAGLVVPPGPTPPTAKPYRARALFPDAHAEGMRAPTPSSKEGRAPPQISATEDMASPMPSKEATKSRSKRPPRLSWAEVAQKPAATALPASLQSRLKLSRQALTALASPSAKPIIKAA